MRVYRLQDKHGTGPYRRRIGEDTLVQMRMQDSHCNWLTHPTELVDFTRERVPGERFGFDNMQRLMAWFGPWLPHLIREGYSVVVYTVPAKHVRYGKSRKQVMFQRKYAKRVDTRK